MHTFKVGDRVRRTNDRLCYGSKFPKGYEFTILALTRYAAVCGMGVQHSLVNLELVTTPMTTADKLAEAEAQVEALRAQLAAEQAPEVGSTYKYEVYEAVVQEIYESHVYYRYRDSRDGRWRQSCRPVTSFIRHYKLVGDADEK